MCLSMMLSYQLTYDLGERRGTEKILAMLKEGCKRSAPFYREGGWGGGRRGTRGTQNASDPYIFPFCSLTLPVFNDWFLMCNTT